MRPRLVEAARPLWLLLALVGGWWLAAAVLDQPRIYPDPGDVAAELGRILSGTSPLGSTYAHAFATLGRLLVAFLVAFVFGTTLGVLAGRIRFVFDFARSLVWIGLAVPSVVWVFIFLVVFGIKNVVPVVALVALLSAPIFIGTAEGAKTVDPDLVEMSRSYRASRRKRFQDLYLPSLVPYMTANARVAFALGIKVVIVAEVVGLPNGIGLLVKYWFDSLYMAPVVAWGLLLIAFGYLVDRFVFSRAERSVANRYGRSNLSKVTAE